ncbi:MAG: hybrid sensor histidine kinase/response regulator [Candidatus Polarisedimenticolia bacterium]
MRLRLSLHSAEPGSAKTVRLALRWMLILATAVLLVPPGRAVAWASFEVMLVLAFVASNAGLSFLPEARFRSRNIEYLVVIADTCLVSLALFHAGLERVHLPLAFFLNLLLAALGRDLPRIMVGATVVSGFYLYLTARGAGGEASMAAVLLRVPFLYVAALYYGYLVSQARADQDRFRRVEREKDELQIFHEVTAATTSTLDLHEVLYVIVRRIAGLVNALRCSILTVDEQEENCTVLASSDDRRISGLVIDLKKYPEIRKAIASRQAVVIDDITREPILKDVSSSLERLGFHSILVLPILFRDSLLGMLFLRAAREDRRFTADEITACQVVANASANAIKNALLYERVAAVARSRKETADKLQNILEHFPDLILTTDLEGRITEFSRGGEAMLGLPRSQVIGKGYADLLPEPVARGRLEGLLRETGPMPGFETRVRCKDGTLRDVLLSAALLRDEGGAPSGTVGIIKDITELRNTRRHLVQAEKLSAMGELVSGVAHELNNPLAGVLGYAQLLMTGPMDARQQKAIDRIFESALRCQKIVQNLLSFARRHPIEKKYLGLNGIIEKTLDLKGYQLRVNNLSVVRRLDSDLPKTMLDFNQIQQVLLNLINNAQYAVANHRGHGTLTLTSTLRDGRILVRVEDDGAGIPSEALGKIFDPFFTTKPVGEGTGLGLAVSYGIVRDHGGRIWAESESGKGTTVFIELPVVAERAAEAPLVPTPESGRPLSVLAVDDEAVILDLLVDAFGQRGYQVDTAASAREALEKLERRTYDVLLLDLKMPEMDGRALFQAIGERWPEQAGRVVFASGDTLQPETQSFLARSGRPCVDKPFRLEELATAVLMAAGDRKDPPRTATA